MSKKTMLVAIRDGVRKEFDTETWASMPKHKYDWVKSADEPESVKAAREAKEAKEKQTAEDAAKQEPELTEEQKAEAKAARKAAREAAKAAEDAANANK